MDDKILDKQKEFQKLLGNDIHSKSFLKEMFLGLQCEVSEALQETDWKSWQANKVVKEENLLEELADIQLFFANIMIARDFNAEQLNTMIKFKQGKNIQRQKDGY